MAVAGVRQSRSSNSSSLSAPAARSHWKPFHELLVKLGSEFIEDSFLSLSCCNCWVSQYRRSFEIAEISWRVRDKFNLAPDSSIQPPLLADDVITQTSAALRSVACCEYDLRADQPKLQISTRQTAVK